MRGKDTQEARYAAFVGIDWADRKHDVVIVNERTGERRHLEVKHSAENLAGLATSLREEFEGQPVAVCIEQGRGAVLHALMHYEHLVMYPVNPKQLKKFREAMYPSGAKDDPRDADLLAELVMKHRNRLKIWVPDDEMTRKLGLLVEHHDLPFLDVTFENFQDGEISIKDILPITDES